MKPTIDPPTQKFTINTQVYEDSICYQCPSCSKKRKVNVKKILDLRKTIHIRCYCQSLLTINFLLPDHFKDKSQLVGKLVNLTRGSQQTRIRIKDLTRTHIELLVLGGHLARKGDRVMIHYLDSNTDKNIIQPAVISQIYGKSISCLCT